MFVMPCKYTQGTTIDDIKKSYVMNSVFAIRMHHPDEKILVVDSDSDDVGYLDFLNSIPNVTAAAAKNKNYSTGSLWYAFNNFPAEKWYCLLQDTVTIKHSFDEFINGDDLFYSLMWFNEDMRGHRELQYLDKLFAKHLENYKTKRVNNIVGCWGPCFLAKREILERFRENDLHLCAPNDKFEAQSHERLWGMCAAYEGIDITKSTIDGDFLSIALPREHFNGKTKYHNKIYGGRQ